MGDIPAEEIPCVLHVVRQGRCKVHLRARCWVLNDERARMKVHLAANLAAHARAPAIA